MQQLFTIARNTFLESIRQPIYLVLLLVGTLALILNPQIAGPTMEYGRGDNKMLIDLGFSTIFICCIFLAAFTATGVLTRELENRTILTVISKPVGRPVFVVAKYLGIVAAMTLAYYILCLIFVLTIRQGVLQTAAEKIDWPVWLFGLSAVFIALILATWGNYAYQWVFTSATIFALAISLSLAVLLVLLIDKEWQLQSPVTDFLTYEGELAQIALGLVMVFQAVLIIAAVAVACSTRLGQVMTLLVCVGIFAIGLVSNSFNLLVHKRLTIAQELGFSQSMGAIFNCSEPLQVKIILAFAKFIYLVAPNFQFFWPADAITQKHDLSLLHIGTVSAYAFIYITLVISLAIAMFQRREIG